MEEITIPMEEYKELLVIKGKYEELKSQSLQIGIIEYPKTNPLNTPWYTNTPISQTPYKITCDCNKEAE